MNRFEDGGRERMLELISYVWLTAGAVELILSSLSRCPAVVGYLSNKQHGQGNALIWGIVSTDKNGLPTTPSADCRRGQFKYKKCFTLITAIKVNCVKANLRARLKMLICYARLPLMFSFTLERSSGSKRIELLYKNVNKCSSN